MTTAFVSHPVFSLHEMGPYHTECPERLAAITDRLIASGLDAYLRHYSAPAATDEQIARAHGQLYIREVEEASPESGLHYIDPDTALNPHTYAPRGRRRSARGGPRHARRVPHRFLRRAPAGTPR